MPDLTNGTGGSQTAEASPSNSVADDIRAAMKASSEPAPPAAAEPSLAPAAASVPENAPPAASDDGRARGPDGKFIAKSPAEEAAAANDAAKAAKPPEQQAAVDGKPPEAAKPTIEPIDAPTHWAAAHKEMFAKQSPEAQRWLVERDRETAGLVTRKTQELADRARSYDEIDRALAPRLASFALNGKTPGAVINQLFAYSDFLAQNPKGFIQQVAHETGVDLRQFGQPTPDGQPAAQSDPIVQQLHGQIGQLQQQIQQLTGHVQTRQQNDETQARTALDNEIASFRDAKDTTGAFTYPHFDEVRADMGALMASGRAADLKTAYEMAVYANPTTREAMLGAQRRKEQADREKSDREKSAQAQRAGSSITGAPAGSVTPQAFATVADELRHHLRNGAGRL